MKKISLWVIGFSLIAVNAAAELGQGYGSEYKTIIIPANQQSGWGVKSETEAEPVKKAVAPKAAPAAQQTNVILQENWTLTGVQFETDSAKLKAESKPALDEAASILKSHPRVVVEIQGHTDNTGAPSANQTLSDARAMAVHDYLVGSGVKSSNLQARGYGDKAPIADNSTESGRAQNRRIQFKVLKK